MAISVRGTSTGPNSNATSTAISLPAGVAAGDVSFICYVQSRNNFAGATLPVLSAPAGYTVLYNNGPVLVCWRAFVGGDATTGITATSTISDWWESTCITYTGLDTSAPIDASASRRNFYDAGSFAQADGTYLAPSLNPNYMGSQLLCIFTENGSSGRVLTLPSGLTARVATSSGPNIRMCDKALTDGTPTGDFNSTVANTTNLHFGMQVALKASGASGATLAAAAPYVAGRYNGLANTGSIGTILDHLGVEDQDLVVFLVSSTTDASNSVPSGFASIASQNSVKNAIYTKKWSTGDSQTPSFGFPTTQWRAWDVLLIRKVGYSLDGVNLDTVASSNVNSASPITNTSASVTPSGTNELLLIYFGTINSPAGAWSGVTGGLVDEDFAAGGPGTRLGRLAGISAATSTYSATYTHASHSNLAVFAALFMIGTPGGGLVRPSVFVCT